MIKSLRLTLLASSLALIGAFSSPAIAQPGVMPGPQAMQPPGGYGPGMMGPMGGYGPGMGPLGMMGRTGVMCPMGMMSMMGGYGMMGGPMGMMGGWGMGMSPFGLLDLQSDQIGKINKIQSDLFKKQQELMRQMLEARLDAQKRMEAVLTQEQKEQLKRWGGYGMMGY